MGLELPFGIKPTNPVFVEETRGPYATVAAANAAVPQAIRLDGLTVMITGDGEYWWLGANLTNIGLIKKQEGSAKALEYTITGNGTTLEFTLTHNLNNRVLAVTTSEGFGPNYEEVFPRIFHLTTNTVKLVFQTAPINTNIYNIVVIGNNKNTTITPAPVGSGIGSGAIGSTFIIG